MNLALFAPPFVFIYPFEILQIFQILRRRLIAFFAYENLHENSKFFQLCYVYIFFGLSAARTHLNRTLVVLFAKFLIFSFSFTFFGCASDNQIISFPIVYHSPYVQRNFKT